jgi:hypothetical protein
MGCNPPAAFSERSEADLQPDNSPARERLVAYSRSDVLR